MPLEFCAAKNSAQIVAISQIRFPAFLQSKKISPIIPISVQPVPTAK
jgi:hypothetical protein